MKHFSARFFVLVMLVIISLNASAQSNIVFVDEFNDPIVAVKSHYFNSDGRLIFQSVSNADGHALIPPANAELGSEITVKASWYNKI